MPLGDNFIHLVRGQGRIIGGVLSMFSTVV